MRLMSFQLTWPAIMDQTKTRTRRCGWRKAKVGDQVLAVRKSRGVRVGDRVSAGVIEFVAVEREPFDYRAMTREDLEAEGCLKFLAIARHRCENSRIGPLALAALFVDMFARANPGWKNGDLVTRIDFRYIEGGEDATRATD